MKFKIKWKPTQIADPEECWWVWEEHLSTSDESKAFVFDSENPDHMQNCMPAFNKYNHVVKVVL